MKRTLHFFTFIIILLLILANSSNPPNGRTGAPGDGLCTNCHSPSGNFTGEVQINGLPGNIMPNTTYPLTVEITNFNGGASRAGFQMVALDANDNNIGTLNAINADVAITPFSGRTYAEHDPAKSFGGNSTVSFDFEWTSPATTGDNVTMYVASVIANGSGTANDDVFTNTASGVIAIPPSPSVSLSSSNVSCNSGSDGSITATASSGTPGYTYLWSNGLTTSSINNLQAGSYSVIVTDAAGQTATGSTTLTEPAPIAFNLISSSSANCDSCDGTAVVSASGGVGGFTYEWGNGVMGNSLNNLCAGNYTVTVSDQNSCSSTLMINIDAVNTLSIDDVEVIDVSCNGENDGSASAIVLGGVAPYTYAWSNGGSTSIVSGLQAGNIGLTVTDANGCVQSTNSIVSEPTELTGTLSTTNQMVNGANDGTANIVASGGTPPYTYLWSNNETSMSISDLAPDTYSVTITDANGCTNIYSGNVNSVGCDLSGSSNSTNVSCNGGNDGTATVQASGGATPYTYQWSNNETTSSIGNLFAGDYTVIVTDALNCSVIESVNISEPSMMLTANIQIMNMVNCNSGNNGSLSVGSTGGTSPYTYIWSNAGTDSMVSNLGSGTYTVTVTDANGCTTESSLSLSEPSSIVISVVTVMDDVDMTGNGSIEVDVQGGTAPYQYQWVDNDGNTVSSDMNPINLSAGNYSLNVTDSNGCSMSSESVTVDSVVDIFDVTIDDNFTLQPNPAKNKLDVQFTLDEVATIQIFDVTGKVSLNKEIYNGNNNIDVSHLTSGIYFCRIQVGDKFAVRKLMIN